MKKQEQFYLSPQVEIVQIAVECGFANSPVAGSANLGGFTVDPTQI